VIHLGMDKSIALYKAVWYHAPLWGECTCVHVDSLLCKNYWVPRMHHSNPSSSIQTNV